METFIRRGRGLPVATSAAGRSADRGGSRDRRLDAPCPANYESFAATQYCFTIFHFSAGLVERKTNLRGVETPPPTDGNCRQIPPGWLNEIRICGASGRRSRLPVSPPGSVLASVAFATEVATGNPQLGRRFCGCAAEVSPGDPRPSSTFHRR